jgi:hypothetical protein
MVTTAMFPSAAPPSRLRSGPRDRRSEPGMSPFRTRSSAASSLARREEGGGEIARVAVARRRTRRGSAPARTTGRAARTSLLSPDRTGATGFCS